MFGDLFGVYFSPGPIGGLFGAHLGAITEARLGSSLGFHFSVFWDLLGNPLVGILGQGLIWGPIWGARFWSCIMGIPGANLGVYIGAHLGAILGVFWGLFEVTLFGVLHIDNSLAFPTSIWKCRDGLGIPVYKLFNSGKMLCAENSSCNSKVTDNFYFLI